MDIDLRIGDKFVMLRRLQLPTPAFGIIDPVPKWLTGVRINHGDHSHVEIVPDYVLECIEWD